MGGRAPSALANLAGSFLEGLTCLGLWLGFGVGGPEDLFHPGVHLVGTHLGEFFGPSIPDHETPRLWFELPDLLPATLKGLMGILTGGAFGTATVAVERDAPEGPRPY